MELEQELDYTIKEQHNKVWGSRMRQGRYAGHKIRLEISTRRKVV
jgi:hypothetical protein